MKLVCLVKLVADVDNFKYDYENNVLIRENVRLLLNPDDVCAVALALRVKATQPDTLIEVVTMGPMSVRPYLEDLIRLGVDQVTLLSDKVFVGSDTLVTSQIIGRYLETLSFDCILTGTHAIDGDTSHVPSQIAQSLAINQMSSIVKVDEEKFTSDSVEFDVDTEVSVATYKMQLPAVLSLTRESKYKLPYIKRQEMSMDVGHRFKILTNNDLGFIPMEVGLKGSPTKVVKTYTKEFNNKGATFVKVNAAGIDIVYKFLKDKGYV